MKIFNRYICLITLLTSLVIACGEQSARVAVPFASLQAMNDSALVTLTNEQVSQAGIQTGALQDRELLQYVETNGYFDVPPQNRAQVSSFKSGYVKTTNLLVGNLVKKGQILVVLENPEYLQIQRQYMEVKGQLEYLKSEYERKKILEAEKITAQKNLLKAQADYNSALAQYQGLKKELQLMGINIGKLESGNYSTTMAIRSPISGTVTEVNTSIGKYVLPQDMLMEIVNSEHLHVELEVFEKDLTKIKIGQKILLRIPSLTGHQYQGEVYLVGKSLDSETRTVHVHGHIVEDSIFVTGMYVEARIIVQSKLVRAVPTEALISEGDQLFLFVALETDQKGTTYQKIAVQSGLQEQQWTEVLSPEIIGMNPKVVLKGSYYLAASMRAAQ